MELRDYESLAGAVNLNIGCGIDRITRPGKWVNVDMNPDVRPDVVVNLGEDDLISVLAASGQPILYDFVVASHVLEHLRGKPLFDLIANVYDLLKPGGRLLAVTPYASSDDAIENPLHVTYFTANTWSYFTRSLYDDPKVTVGYRASQGMPLRDWSIEQIVLIPRPEFVELANKDRAGFERMVCYQRNTIVEIHAVMRRQRALYSSPVVPEPGLHQAVPGCP
jgi:SAM-dependent methyltransferase